MDAQTRNKLKNEVAILKSLISSASSLTAGMQQSAFPVMGPIVNIPALPMAANVIRAQNDCLAKMADLLNKMLDES